MADMVTITRANMADATALLELSITTFCEAFGAQNRQEDMDKYIAVELTINKLEAELCDEGNHFFLAWYDERLAGYAKIRKNAEAGLIARLPLEIERIYVRQELHSKKIGAALMQHCIDFATANQHDVVWLGVWQLNHKAINFYRQWGFDFFGAHPFLLGDDMQTDLLMQKVIK